jgi:hypothetical protein
MKSIILDWNEFHDSNIYRKTTLQPTRTINHNTYLKPFNKDFTTINHNTYLKPFNKDFTSFGAFKLV